MYSSFVFFFFSLGVLILSHSLLLFRQCLLKPTTHRDYRHNIPFSLCSRSQSSWYQKLLLPLGQAQILRFIWTLFLFHFYLASSLSTYIIESILKMYLESLLPSPPLLSGFRHHSISPQSLYLVSFLCPWTYSLDSTEILELHCWNMTDNGTLILKSSHAHRITPSKIRL